MPFARIADAEYKGDRPRTLFPVSMPARACAIFSSMGRLVDSPDQVASAWEQALATDRPVVVEFKTDPEVPPLPPHITLKQAKAFVATLWKGDPEESGVIVGTARQILSSILPGGSDKK